MSRLPGRRPQKALQCNAFRSIVGCQRHTSRMPGPSVLARSKWLVCRWNRLPGRWWRKNCTLVHNACECSGRLFAPPGILVAFLFFTTRSPSSVGRSTEGHGRSPRNFHTGICYPLSVSTYSRAKKSVKAIIVVNVLHGRGNKHANIVSLKS